MDWKSWRTELRKDAEILELLTFMVADITPQHDTKLQELFQLLSEKISTPNNPGNPQKSADFLCIFGYGRVPL